MRCSDTVTVAVAQVGSVFMDREACLSKACAWIKEAGKNGAQIIVFPEAFLSGYPRGLRFDSAIGSRGAKGKQDWVRYWRSSVAVPSDALEPLASAIQEANSYVVMGVTEQASESGTLYCTLLYYGPDGTLLGKHRKLKPTAIERLIWGEGDGSTLFTTSTPYGRLGGLICWENYMPLARMAMYSQGVNLYVAPTADQRSSWQATIQHIACEGRCFVLAANQFVRKEDYPTDLACYSELEQQPDIMCRGGSAIVNPFGEYLAGPLYDQEQLLYAELDLQQIDQGHLDFDVMGHYARPDVFLFRVNDPPQR
ncbi:carbon-nitrogen hydrolase family protein [Tengunoibacter tsumagoiensis]|nr:carbon-nitrogen hydrolase family protein [Tengunoibacter tsumagoiensis]